MNPYKETINTLNHERKTIASIFRVIVKEGYKDSYRNLNAFLAEYNEGSGRRYRKIFLRNGIHGSLSTNLTTFG